MSKKIILKLDMHDGRDKQKAIKAVAAIVGIDTISVDLPSQKMTVIGTVDPVKVVSKLRKASCPAAIISIGPAKEPEKKEEKKEEKEKKEGEGEKKDEKKEEKKEGEGEKKDAKKDEKKEGEGEKKDEKKEGDGEKKAASPTEQQIISELLNHYRAYHPYYMTPPPPPPPPPHYYVHSMEESPNSCTIC